MFNIILFGPPGSGKGTQAKIIEEKYDLHHISTGDLFRYELKNETELGKKIKHIMESGELVPDEITIEMLKNKILSFDNPKGFLLDGFPRNNNQAKELDKLFEELGEEVNVLISLDVPEEEIVQRILNRGKTSGRSDDNDESIIRGRYQVYKDQTLPVFEYYQNKNKARTVNGVGDIDEISNRILCAVEEHNKK
ncbi:MAG TPA: adenylate kinase [Bacteroidetes bacterium]|nr:adenylate kinase [Bacteroidota bacterium]